MANKLISNQRNLRTLLGCSVLLGFVACAPYNPNEGRYSQRFDSGPSGSVDVSHIPDAVPRAEPRTKAGNKSPYRVLGKTYYVMDDATGFTEVGEASWYGNKFHGHKTANGEIYNMYGMTAAHKSIPIPSYVRVTNLKNNRSVVVRVNDRGPFHGGRIIDLSYTAAKKLDYLKQGTARVKVEVLEPGAPMNITAGTSGSYGAGVREPVRSTTSAVTPAVTVQADDGSTNHVVVATAGNQLPDRTFLQVGAFSREDSALRLVSRLRSFTDHPVNIVVLDDSLFRVRIGPIVDNVHLLTLREELEARNFAKPHVVYE